MNNNDKVAMKNTILFAFYVLATSKIISRMGTNFDILI